MTSVHSKDSAHSGHLLRLLIPQNLQLHVSVSAAIWAKSKTRVMKTQHPRTAPLNPLKCRAIRWGHTGRFFFFLPSLIFFFVCSLPSWKAETDGFCGAAIPSAVMSTSSLIKWNLDTTIFLGQTREQQMRAWGTSRAAAVVAEAEEEEEATERKRGWRGGIASPPPNSCACVLCEKRVE